VAISSSPDSDVSHWRHHLGGSYGESLIESSRMLMKSGILLVVFYPIRSILERISVRIQQLSGNRPSMKSRVPSPVVGERSAARRRRPRARSAAHLGSCARHARAGGLPLMEYSVRPPTNAEQFEKGGRRRHTGRFNNNNPRCRDGKSIPALLRPARSRSGATPARTLPAAGRPR